MTLSIDLQPIVVLIAGIAILIAPRLLNYFVGFCLIVTGIVGLGLVQLASVRWIGRTSGSPIRHLSQRENNGTPEQRSRK